MVKIHRWAIIVKKYLELIKSVVEKNSSKLFQLSMKLMDLLRFFFMSVA